MKLLYYSLLSALLVLCVAGCTKDSLPEPEPSTCDPALVPTYTGAVAEIIERTCAYSGCHLGGAPGVYNSFDGLLPDLETGRFRERTITLQADPTIGMPPDYAPPGHPKNLTEEELSILACWLEGGYPQE